MTKKPTATATAEAPKTPPADHGSGHGPQDRSGADLAVLHAQNPGGFKPYASVNRVPPNGDMRAAQYIDRAPIEALPEIEDWLSRHPEGGPGIYAVQLIDNRTAHKVATAYARVGSDKREAKRAAGGEDIEERVARRVKDELARASGGTSPFDAGLKMLEIFGAFKNMTGTGGAAPPLDFEKTLELGEQLGRLKSGSAGKEAAEPGIIATIIEKHGDRALEALVKTVEVVGELVKERSKRKTAPPAAPMPPQEPKEAVPETSDAEIVETEDEPVKAVG